MQSHTIFTNKSNNTKCRTPQGKGITTTSRQHSLSKKSDQRVKFVSYCDGNCCGLRRNVIFRSKRLIMVADCFKRSGRQMLFTGIISTHEPFVVRVSAFGQTVIDTPEAGITLVAVMKHRNDIDSHRPFGIVLPPANDQGRGLRPGPFDQPVHTIAVSQVIDVWAKRSARAQAAERGVDVRRLVVADALRTIVHAVRAAFVEVLREQAEHRLALDTAERYDGTVRLSRSRFAAGDISEAELRKVELEGLRYQNATIDADMQLDLARARLAALMGLPGPGALPGEAAETPLPADMPAAEVLVARALDRRPDLRAARALRTLADAQLAAARREAYPDISVGPSYTHSGFTASGDNPNSLGLSLSLPLPIFDRNQANVGRARLDIRHAENEEQRLALLVRQDVADAVRRTQRSRQLVAVFEGGMLKRAEDALRTSERAYRAGASSLLEFLEAQRTYLETHGQYLRALHDLRQALIDVSFVVTEGE